MLLTCTNKNYKSQSLVVPILGTITLDENCSFECPDDKAEDFIKHSSLPFVKEGEVVAILNQAKTITGTLSIPTAVIPFDLEAHLVDKFKSSSEKEVNEFFDSIKVKILEEQNKLADAKKQAAKETEETVVDREGLIEAINAEENIDELKNLIPLIPGIKKKDVKNIQTPEELKAFLISKVNEAKSN